MTLTRITTAAVIGMLAAAGLGPASLVGQSGGGTVSILTLLPSSGTIEIGSETTGRLSGRDVVTTAGQRVQAFELSGSAGEPLTVDLRSTEFDSYLFLVGPGYDEPFQDDDSGGACNARIATFLPADGVYRIVVGALNGEEGAFELIVDRRAHPEAVGECGGDPALAAALAALEPASESLTVGSSADGTLDESDVLLPDGTYARAYTLSVEAGQEFTVDLTSSAFDSMLRLLTSDGLLLVSDDDGAGACNSRVTYAADEAVEYRLVVGTLISSTGPFRLVVSAEPGPTNPAACTG